MKSENYIKLEFPSKSVNEGFARAAAAAFEAHYRYAAEHYFAPQRP